MVVTDIPLSLNNFSQQEKVDSLTSLVEILRKEMTTLTNTVQKQNKEIETLKGERLTVNCDCNGNDNDDDTAVFNNATLQGLYLHQICARNLEIRYTCIPMTVVRRNGYNLIWN